MVPERPSWDWDWDSDQIISTLPQMNFSQLILILVWIGHVPLLTGRAGRAGR